MTALRKALPYVLIIAAVHGVFLWLWWLSGAPFERSLSAAILAAGVALICGIACGYYEETRP